MSFETAIIQAVKELPNNAGYRLTLTTGEVYFVPNDPANSQYQLIQTWISEGNTPEPPYTLDEKKVMLKNAVRDQRRLKENLGIIITGSGGTATYHFDTSQVGRMNLANTIQTFDIGNLDKLNDTVNWKFKDGSFISLTYDQLVEISKFVTQYIESLFNAEQTHYSNIDALADLSSAEAYDVSANWPANDGFLSTLLP